MERLDKVFIVLCIPDRKGTIIGPTSISLVADRIVIKPLDKIIETNCFKLFGSVWKDSMGISVDDELHLETKLVENVYKQVSVI